MCIVFYYLCDSELQIFLNIAWLDISHKDEKEIETVVIVL